MSSSARPSVFVSYHHADRSWAEWIAWTLEEADYRVVLQAWDFRPGANFVLEMDKAVAETERMLIVLSDSYLRSDFTQLEWATALAGDPKGLKGKLLPVRVAPCHPEGLLKAIIAVDLVGLSEASARKTLLLSFADRGKPHSAPAFPGGALPSRVVPNAVRFPGVPSSRTLSNPFGNRLCPACFASGSEKSPCRCGYAGEKNRARISLPAGAVLEGNFVVGLLLGKGSFGITYLGWDRLLERKVAIKEYLPPHLAGRDTGDREVRWPSPKDKKAFLYGYKEFVKEARTVAGLHHRHIVKVQRIIKENGTAYMVMDYHGGVSLDQHLEDGKRLPAAEAVEILLPILEALSYIHTENLLHLDIKPSNIFLEGHRTPILLDFGGARTALWERTSSLAKLLSPGYAPLEQYISHSRRIGTWTDVYAAAATLYRMLTGKTPPAATSRYDSDTLEPPHHLLTGLSPRLSEVVLKGLAIQSEDRIQDVEEFSDSLQDALKPTERYLWAPPDLSTLQSFLSSETEPAPEPAPLQPPGELAMPQMPSEQKADETLPAEPRPAPPQPPGELAPSEQVSGKRLPEKARGRHYAAYESHRTRLNRRVRDLREDLSGAATISLVRVGIGSLLLCLLGYWLYLSRQAIQLVAIPDEASARAGEQILIPVLSNDRTRTGRLSLSSVGEPSVGTVRQGPNETIIYSPPLDFSGSDRFTYTVTNSRLRDSTEVRVTVQGLKAGEVRRNQWDSMEYAWVPPGEFQMGCTPQVDSPCKDNEGPPHQVRVARGFWMATTEVTVKAFDLLDTRAERRNLSPFNPNHPRVNVTWSEADEFCQLSGGRLPTEAEWEYAARSGKSQRYGNVYEWCEDTYHRSYNGAPSDGTPWISSYISHRVIRGGSWKERANSSRTASRSFAHQDERRADLGFRCVRDILPDSAPRPVPPMGQ